MLTLRAFQHGTPLCYADAVLPASGDVGDARPDARPPPAPCLGRMGSLRDLMDNTQPARRVGIGARAFVAAVRYGVGFLVARRTPCQDSCWDVSALRLAGQFLDLILHCRYGPGLCGSSLQAFPLAAALLMHAPLSVTSARLLCSTSTPGRWVSRSSILRILRKLEGPRPLV